MRLLAALSLAFVVTGCADPATTGVRTTPTATPTYAADGVVLRVSYEGGLIPPGSLATVPYWSLTGDGRIFTLGPVPEIYPGPAFPNVRVATVSRATVDRIADAAREAGVDGVERDYGSPLIADASTTVFRLTNADGTVTTTKVYALAESETGGNEARRTIATFFRHLTDLNGWLGAGTVGDDTTYEPAAVAIYARSYVPDTTNGITPQKVAWTGPDPGAGEGTGAGTCTVLTGAVLAKVLPDLRGSNTLTRWRTGDADWAFTIRPLLPDERTCDDGVR